MAWHDDAKEWKWREETQSWINRAGSHLIPDRRAGGRIFNKIKSRVHVHWWEKVLLHEDVFGRAIWNFCFAFFVNLHF